MERQIPEKQSNHFNAWYIWLSLVGFILILVGHPYSISKLIAVGTWCIVVSCVFGFITVFLGEIEANNVSVLFLMIFSTLISFLVSLEMTYDNFVVLFCYLEIPLFFSFIKEVRIKKLKEKIYILFYILSCFYIYLSRGSLAYSFDTIYGERYLNQLTLGYNNPNETAMYLSFCFIVLLSGIFYFENQIVKLAFIINDIIIFSLIFKTESRACILISVLCILFLFFLKSSYSFSLFSKAIGWAPLVWALIVLLFHNEIENISFLGDSIETGRLSIYMRPFENMTFMSFFFGKFSEFSFENLHNAYVTVFATTGIIGVVIFIYFINKKILSLNENFSNLNYSEKIGFFGMLMIILHSSAEAAILTAGSVYAVSFIILYFIAFYDFNARSECD